jgi:uncharacterized glyoxalase superfamily protein PhnB
VLGEGLNLACGAAYYGDTPMAKEVPAEWSEKILHATLSFDGSELTGSNVQSDHDRRSRNLPCLWTSKVSKRLADFLLLR